MDPINIAVSGCGPAGLAAALLLGRAGHSVRLFDQFETPGPVGSGLMIQPTGLAVLDRLGLAEKIIERGARIDALKGVQENGRVALDAHYSKLGVLGAFGIGIHRASLFETLHASVMAAAIPIETGRVVAGSDRDPDGRWLTFADGTRSACFDLVVDANGWRSPFDSADDAILPFGALWASLPQAGGDPFHPHLLEQRYRRARQMVGVLPIGKRPDATNAEYAFFWSLKRRDLEAWQAAPLEQWKDEVAHLWPETACLLDRITSHDQLTFASYAHRTKRPVRSHRLIAIGDAWHSASPQLGQGANMALLDAWSLARGLSEARTLDEALRMAIGWRKDHVALYQWVTAIFTPLYQSEAAIPPWLRDNILAPLSQIWPVTRIQALLMSGLFGWPLAQLGLAPPDYPALAQRAAAISSPN